MTHTRHALERASERLGVVLSHEIIEDIVTRADTYARAATCDTAVRLARTGMVGQAWSEHSNGDTIIAIIRARTVVTFMFRRSSQPFTPTNLQVSEVIDAS